LLFKYLDAREDLSIQVHPNDELAKKDISFGKTEMWYIMQADDDARIIVGFKENRMPVDRKSRKQNLTFYSGRYKSKIR
jgi:mannose-6-phosphate isomerase